MADEQHIKVCRLVTRAEMLVDEINTLDLSKEDPRTYMIQDALDNVFEALNRYKEQDT